MTPQMVNDDNLLKASMDGNADAFGALVQKYQAYIRTLTYSATSDAGKSEEIAQDVFVIAWRHLSQLRDYSKFKSWLNQIARHEIVKYYKKKEQDVIYHAASVNTAQTVQTSTAGPEENAISKERREFIQQALSRIPDHYREPLILYYWEGRSVRQVAQMFELNEDAAKKRISRARGMLRADVEAVVEETISKTSSCGKFSASVIGLIAAGGILNASTASAAAIPATAGFGLEGGTGIVSTLLHSMAAKIAAIAAIVVLSTGSFFVLNQPAKTDSSDNIIRPLPKKLKSGLVLYFSFDNVQNEAGQRKIIDDSGAGNNGIVTGGVFSSGKFGRAFGCNAQNKRDGIIVKDSDSLDLDAVTIAVWIKTSRQDSQWGRILDKGWQSAYNLCIGGEFKGQLWIQQMAFECANSSIISRSSVVDGQWHFVAGSYDGHTYKLYIDGRLDIQNMSNTLGPLRHNRTDIHIGSLAVPEMPPYHEAYYDGLIDELRLYNRILSDEEILTLYQYRPGIETKL